MKIDSIQRLVPCLLALLALACAGEEARELPTRTFLRIPVTGTWTVGEDPTRPAGIVLRLQEAAAPGDSLPPVLVPAAGTVVRVADAPAGEPGSGAIPLGTHVVIRHRADEYSVLAGLRPGSVTVEPGQSVFPGRPLARVGTVGEDGAPGLLVLLREDPDGVAVPFHFRMYEADGQRVPVGRPVAGETVRSLWTGVASPPEVR